MLLNGFNIDFLLERIGTFEKLRVNEVYVYVRVVLTRVDLYSNCRSTSQLSIYFQVYYS